MRNVPRGRWRGGRGGIALTLVVALLLGPLWPSLAAAQEPVLSDDDRDEVEQGREADRQIEAEFGFYEDDELAAYVDRIGQEVAAVSERPQLPWSFRVLDSPVVNAFAIPGGFVYVTRGLLAHMNSEAELAGVLGHEVGHVTGRHSQARQRRSLWATLGLLGAAIAVPKYAGPLLRSGIAQNVLGLVFLKYSRDQELDADERGIRYATVAGYDPRGIGGFFATLQNLEEQTDRKGVPGWLSTHPQVDDRIERGERWAAEALARAGVDPADLVQGRTPHLLAVDDVVFGENPREGFTRGDEFLHPDLRFAVTFPSGWQVKNARQAVTVGDPRERAMLQLTLAPSEGGDRPADTARAYLQRIRARVDSSAGVEVNGLRAHEAVFAAQGENATYAVYGLWIGYEGRVYELLGITTPGDWRDYRATFRNSLQTFRRLTDEAVLAVQPARVRLVRAPGSMQLQGLLEANPQVSVEPSTIAIINQRPLDSMLEAGALVKLVEGGVEDLAEDRGVEDLAEGGGVENVAEDRGAEVLVDDRELAGPGAAVPPEEDGP